MKYLEILFWIALPFISITFFRMLLLYGSWITGIPISEDLSLFFTYLAVVFSVGLFVIRLNVWINKKLYNLTLTK